MAKIVIYTKEGCPFCKMAKDFFASKNLPFDEIRVDLDTSKLEEMLRLSNRRTVPQIFINEQSIGGYDDLTALIKAGKFDDLLKT